jgi:putative MATE family efflux protein
LNIDLTHGNITHKLLAVSWPMIVDFILQGLVAIVDVAMVGRLGSESIAALGFARPIVWFLFAFFGGFNQAVNALVARHTGAKDHESAHQTAFHSLLFTTYIGILAGFLIYFFLPSILSIFAIEDSVRQLMASYLKVIALGIVFAFYTYILTGIFQGMGHTKIQLYVTAIMNVLNVVLSYFLIIKDQFIDIIPIQGMGLGVAGAAWSLVITRAIGALILFFLLRTGKYSVHLKFSSFKPLWNVIRPMSTIGLPLGMMGIAGSSMFIIINEIAARTAIGTNAISALTVGQLTESFAYMPSIGFMGGVMIMVGQNIGAGKLDRVDMCTDIGAKIHFVYLAIWGLMYLLFPISLVRIFTNDTAVIYPAAMYIIIFGVPVVSYFILPYAGALRAAGDTTVPMIINLVAMFGIRVPLCYYLALHTRMDYEGIWWAMATGMVFEQLALLIRYKQGVWRRIKL